MAVLTTAAAHDPGWRHAFAATANGLAQSGQVPIIAGDYSGPIPWVASPARDGSVLGQLFTAMGLDYRPATEPIAMGSPAASPREAAGLSTGARSSVPEQAGPVSGAPSQYDDSPSVRSYTVSPYQQPSSEAQPPRRRTGLLAGVLGLVVGLLLGAGAVAVVLWPDGDDSDDQVQPSTGPTITEPTFPPPSQPGIEPPADGEWPAAWPAFGADEPVSQMAGLIGELDGQAFQVPDGWDCPSVAAEGTFAHYTCGPDGDPSDIGGDLIIRFCPDPCDAQRRDQMRTEVEAWGLQWVRDFGFRSWAETNEIDGEDRYGLVVVAYYRTTPEGRIDRQLVLRMTAPVEQADEIRKVANSVREAMI